MRRCSNERMELRYKARNPCHHLWRCPLQYKSGHASIWALMRVLRSGSFLAPLSARPSLDRVCAWEPDTRARSIGAMAEPHYLNTNDRKQMNEGMLRRKADHLSNNTCPDLVCSPFCAITTK